MSATARPESDWKIAVISRHSESARRTLPRNSTAVRIIAPSGRRPCKQSEATQIGDVGKIE